VEVVAVAALIGKSRLARLITGRRVKIVDLDISQASTNWKQRRERAGIKPDLAVEPFGTVAQALKVAQFLRPLGVRIPAERWSLRSAGLDILKKVCGGSELASGAPAGKMPKQNGYERATG
jgi:hypothetical protein